MQKVNILALNKAKAKILKQGYSLAGYARAKGFNKYTFRMWLRGEWGQTSGPGSVAEKFKKELEKDGFLA